MGIRMPDTGPTHVARVSASDTSYRGRPLNRPRGWRNAACIENSSCLHSSMLFPILPLLGPHDGAIPVGRKNSMIKQALVFGCRPRHFPVRLTPRCEYPIGKPAQNGGMEIGAVLSAAHRDGSRRGRCGPPRSPTCTWRPISSRGLNKTPPVSRRARMDALPGREVRAAEGGQRQRAEGHADAMVARMTARTTATTSSWKAPANTELEVHPGRRQAADVHIP